MSYLALREATSLRHRTLRGEVPLCLRICESGRRRSASRQKKIKELRPLREKEKRGKFGKPKSEDDLAFFPTGAGQKRKFTLLDTNESVRKVTWRLLSFPCKLFYIFTHFSFPLFFFFFFLVELLIHWGKMAGQLDCQCYCAT